MIGHMKHGHIGVGRARLCTACFAGLLITSCSGRAGDLTGPDAIAPPHEWRVWRDEQYGFQLRYPKDVVVLPESQKAPADGPRSLRRVRFQHETIAAGAFADREPARFSIEVFENSRRESLRGWLMTHGRLPPGAEVTSINVAGAREALRVALRQALAPNEFVYAASERYVYALTPLGEHGEDMLASFLLEGRQ
jgi:hypothetical protein